LDDHQFGHIKKLEKNKNKNPDGHKCGLSREGEVVWDCLVPVRVGAGVTKLVGCKDIQLLYWLRVRLYSQMVGSSNPNWKPFSSCSVRAASYPECQG
jgi:hypothetical protein